LIKMPYGFSLAGWSDIRRVVSRADVVLEVIDARDPLGTRSRRLERIVEEMGRELLLVLNKSDLVPRAIVEEWTHIFRDRGYRAVYVAATRHCNVPRFCIWDGIMWPPNSMLENPYSNFMRVGV